MHENIAAVDLAGGLMRQEPEVASDVLFGARALRDRGPLGGPSAGVVGGGSSSLRVALAEPIPA